MKSRISVFHGVLRAVFLSLTLGFASIIWLTYSWVVRPLAERSTDDFAALLTSSVNAFSVLPAPAQSKYLEALYRQSALQISVPEQPLTIEVSHHPYLNLLRESLYRHLGSTTDVRVGEGPDLAFHVDIRTREGWLRVSFDKQRVSPRPRLAVILGLAVLLSGGAATSWILARYLSGPVVRLADCVRLLGVGKQTTEWPESRFAEMQTLSDAFRQLSRAQAEQREAQITLMAGISHDLRSPMARLSMALGMLSGPHGADVRARMESDIGEMNRLIAAQMDLTRAQHPESAEALDVSVLLQEVADAAEAQCPGCVRLQVPRQPCEALLPPTALRRVLTNLIDNAQAYAGGRIDIACRQIHGTLCIGVRDRGPGIPQAFRAAVFRPFYRLDPARQRSTGGNGLGLAIASQLAQTHGWTLGLRPRYRGGSSFWLLIPMARASVRLPA